MATNNNNKALNVPHLRFPEFTGEWKKCKFGDIATGFDYGMNAAAKPFDGENKYIRITDIDEVSSTYDDKDIVSPDGILTDNYAVNDRDILLARTGASTGKSYLYRKSDGKLYYAGFLIRANITEHNPYFVFSQLHTHRYWRWVSIMSARSGQPGINSQEYSSFPIFTTSLHEENKIASLLSRLDERIATQNKIIEDLEKLKSALTDQLYSGQLRFHEFTDDWVVSTFGHLTEHFSHRNQDSKHYPVFSVTKNTGFIPQEEQFESREIAGDDISSYKIIQQGEFAYNPARINVGSIARYDNKAPCLISSLYVCIKPAADIDSDWLLYLLKSKRSIYYYNLYGEGGVRIYLFYPNFSRIKVKVPSIQEQRRIATLLESITAKIQQEKKLKGLYITQKQFLLQRMFI